jgi:hypothetical protein
VLAPPTADPSAAALLAAAERFVGHVGHWTPQRWQRPVRDGGLSRADAVLGLAQELADLGAESEGHPPYVVPRLENPLALPDQIRVMVGDLLRHGAPGVVLRRATLKINTITRLL